MKWIEISVGHYRLVSDSDPRPEDKKFVKRLNSKKTTGSFFISTKPPYYSLSKKVDGRMGKKGAERDTKIFEEIESEKQKELRTSSKARNYEEGRKKDWQKYKPEWVRRGRNTKELSVMRQSQ